MAKKSLHEEGKGTLSSEGKRRGGKEQVRRGEEGGKIKGIHRRGAELQEKRERDHQ